jgi:hypothetical protein
MSAPLQLLIQFVEYDDCNIYVRSRRAGERVMRSVKTGSRSPEVSSTAFDAQPLDLHSVPLMDVGFATIGQLARTPPASYPVLVHRLAYLLRASFRPRLAAGVVSPLHFAITSPPSRCEEDLHLPAVDHARHTKKRGSQDRLPLHHCRLRFG